MTTLVPVDECEKILQSPDKSVKDKYEILYHLRTHADEESAEALRRSYPFLNSDLLQHEVMFILGQIKRDCSLEYLSSVLCDEKESPVVRHEAGEALSNFFKFEEKVIPVLEKFKDHENPLIQSTARIGLKKLEYSGLREKYGKFIPGSIEPGAPFDHEELMEFLREKNYIKEGEFFVWPMIFEITPETVENVVKKSAMPLERMLFDDSLHEFYKYRLMYYLRNKKDIISAVMLSRIMEKSRRSKSSPLLRHEVGLCAQVNY
jgi:deoxyhypusine monooxygenase